MAATTEELNISISADIRQLKKQLAEMPGVGKREAAQMVNGIRQQYKKAEKAAKKLADKQVKEAKRASRAVQKDTEEMFRGLSTAGKTFEGQVGGAVSVVEDFLDGIGGVTAAGGVMAGAMATVAASVAAAGFAMAAAGAAAFELAGAAVESGERLTKMGRLSADSQLAVAELGTSLGAVQLATDQATVAFAAATPELRTFLDVVSGGIKIAADFIEQTRGLRDTLAQVGRVSLAVTSLGLSELALKGMRVAAEEGEKLNAVVKEYALLQDDTFVGPPAPTGVKRATAAVKEQKQEVEELTLDLHGMAGAFDTAIQAALAAAAEIEAQYWSDLADSFATVSAEAEAAALAIPKMTDRGMWEGVSAALAAGTESFAQLSEFATTQLGEVAGLSSDIHARNIENLDAEMAKEQQAFQKRRERLKLQLEAGKITRSQFKLEMGNVKIEAEARKAAHKEVRDEQKKAAMRSFRAGQAAQIAQATIDAARAAMALIPVFAFAGPGAPAAAAGAAGLALGIQLAKIRSQDPPQFTRGGAVSDRLHQSPDHLIIGARATEGIVSDRGMAAIGGREGLRRLNDGGGMMAPMVVVQMDGRMLGDATAAVLDTDPRVSTVIDRRTGTLPGIRTVTGG
jgi:hypothetical protein